MVVKSRKHPPPKKTNDKKEDDGGLWGFIKDVATKKIGYNDIKKVYKALNDYTYDRLWDLVPDRLGLLPEEAHRRREEGLVFKKNGKIDLEKSIPIIATVDTRGSSLLSIIEEIMKAGGAKIRVPFPKGAEALDEPFKEIPTLIPKRGLAPGRVYKMAQKEDPYSMFAMRGPEDYGYPPDSSDILYLRRPIIGLRDPGVHIVGPKGSEHYVVEDAAREAGANIRAWHPSGFFEGQVPTHGWLYRDSPTSFDFETAYNLDPIRRGNLLGNPWYEKSLRQLISDVLESGRYSPQEITPYGIGYPPYQSPTPVSAPSGELLSDELLPLSEIGYRTAPSRSMLAPQSDTAAREEIARAIEELMTDVPSSSAIVRPSDAESSFYRWLQSVNHWSPESSPIGLGPGASNIMPYSSRAGSYSYNGYFPWWLDWVNTQYHAFPQSRTYPR